MYPKDTEKWKQFTTLTTFKCSANKLFCIPKILKNESNSQQKLYQLKIFLSCFVSQRYWKMKAIHNSENDLSYIRHVVLYPKDTEKWKQFTTYIWEVTAEKMLFCIPKILKNESNSQLPFALFYDNEGCFVSQRYWKMKAIHNRNQFIVFHYFVVLYPKDTKKWNLAKGKQGDSA